MEQREVIYMLVCDNCLIKPRKSKACVVVDRITCPQSVVLQVPQVNSVAAQFRRHGVRKALNDVTQ